MIIKVKRKPHPQMVWEELGPDAVSKSAFEHRGVMGDPDFAQVRDEARVEQVLIREASLDSTLSWESLGKNYLLRSSQLR